MTCEQCLQHEWLSPSSSPSAILSFKTNLVASMEPKLVTESNDEETMEQTHAVTPQLQQNHLKIIVSTEQNEDDNCDIKLNKSGQSGTKEDDEEVVMHTSVTLSLPPRRSSTSLSYDSDKENFTDKSVVANIITNGETESKSSQQFTDDLYLSMQSNLITPYSKSHKRLSSDIFPSPEHQKWIAVVSATTSTLKKYTSESSMTTMEVNGVADESAQNDSNNNLMKEVIHSVHEIPIVVEGDASGPALATIGNNTNNQESSPPSTPNKKIYLSADDSMSFGLFTPGSNVSTRLFNKFFSPSNLNITSTSRFRSVSVERLNSSARVMGHFTIEDNRPSSPLAATTLGLCVDSKGTLAMDQLVMGHHHLSSPPTHHHHHHSSHHLSSASSSTTTISCSSTSSSSLSSLVSSSSTITGSTMLTKHHQQEISSPSF